MKGDEIQIRKKIMFQSKTRKYSNKNKEKIKSGRMAEHEDKKKFITRLSEQARGQKWLDYIAKKA